MEYDIRKRWYQRQASTNDHTALALACQHHVEQFALMLRRTGDKTAISSNDIEVGDVCPLARPWWGVERPMPPALSVPPTVISARHVPGNTRGVKPFGSVASATALQKRARLCIGRVRCAYTDRVE